MEELASNDLVIYQHQFEIEVVAKRRSLCGGDSRPALRDEEDGRPSDD